MNPRIPLFSAALATALVWACGGDMDTSGEDPSMDTPSDEGAPASMAPAVEIVTPADGSEVEGSTVTVDLAAHGFQVVEAGDTTANSGHHHLFLDRDVSPPGQPIPAEEGHIVHMGDGSTTFQFMDVEPGEHTLIAVVGDAYHVPVPGLQDTIRFTVR